MDPASAIGTASAVLSFVTFANGLVTGAVAIYKNNRLVENATIEDVLGEMRRFSTSLRTKRIQHIITTVLTASAGYVESIVAALATRLC
jgi:hypothetical protein